MKCLVLAGGSSDRLWPLSRKDYPKQFMEIREGRSMFQDAILRNLPFCDEFVIITNKKYENVARGQLQAFQGLEYRFMFEEVALKTAPAVIMCALQCDPDEELLIVSTDCIIEGDYNADIMQVCSLVKEDKFVAVACTPTNSAEGYNYINRSNKKVVFTSKRGKNSLWDCGIFGAKACVFIESVDKDLVDKCKAFRLINDTIKINENAEVPSVSLGKIITTNDCHIICASFTWNRITDISSFYRYYDKILKNDNNAIRSNCKGVEIVNTVDEQLIVANGLKNIVIVNTRDTIYVTNTSKEGDVKSIANKYYANKKQYFDKQPKKYEDWGMEEFIGSADNCKVKIVSVYSDASFEIKPKKNTTVNLFITQGSGRLESSKGTFDYGQNQNITIDDTIKYTIYNIEKTNLVFVCTEKTVKNDKNKIKRTESLVKMNPSFKDNLWGGTKIRDVFGKDVGDLDIIAESWELSAHPDGESRIAFGEFAGKTLTEYINQIGKDKLGWKAQAYDKFPIMIKFIDARQNLSIQVHPSDDYAMTNEGEYGKNEMWHILDADEDACIYVGFKTDVTPEEIKERIKNDTLMQIINKVPVKKNETYFLKAGTVHAIGSGCLICEVQQSSNVTYRLYDYGRKDKNGKLRELHVDKALDVLDLKAYSPETYIKYEAVMRSDYVKTLIGQCKYFTVNKFFVDGECVLPKSESSFQAFVVLDGKGTISDGYDTYKTKSGDTWFCTSMEQITLKGKCSVLAINI